MAALRVRGLPRQVAVGWKAMLAGVGRARTLGLAAEMSFWLFLSLVPLAAVAGWLAARVATSQPRFTSSMLASVPLATRELLERQLHRVAAWNGSAVAPLAFLTFVWLAASGIHAVFEALEVQSGTSRPWWRKRVLALVSCVALAVGSALVALLAVGLRWAGALAGRALPRAVTALAEGTVADAVRLAFAVLLAISMTAGVYRVGIPRGRGSRGPTAPILPGAVLSVGLQALLGWGYGLYVSKLESGSVYQASLAVVGVTLMTLWLFSIALLLGVNLNAAIATARAGRPGASRALREREREREPERERMAGRLRYRGAWPSSDASSSPPTSPTPPTAPSTGPSTSRPGSAPRSR